MRFAPALLLVSGLLAGCAERSTETAEQLVQKAQHAAAAHKDDDARRLLDLAIATHPTNALPHFVKGLMLDNQRQFAPALASLDRALALSSNLAPAYQARGMVKFKTGDMDGALRDFAHFLVRRPDQIPHHWQRGIALYYAGQFKSGVLQFTEHQRVNPNDVENAAWHFLCNARATNVEQARKELIPITGDARVPMKEIHDLYAGRGTPEKVLAAAETAGPDDAARRNARCYAHLYLGLYFEALGDAAKSREHIVKAAKDYSMDHYMGDVARVHLKLRDEAAKKK